MKMDHVFISWGEYPASSAEIDVPGLGKVTIKDFISDEARERIEKEAILSLNQKLGIICTADR